MPTPSAYLDECMDIKLAEALHRRGFTAVTTSAARMLGATDEDQLLYAGAQGMVLVTHNRRHFRRLHRLFQEEQRLHGGIILLSRTTPLSRLTMRTTMMLDWIASLDDFHNRLFSWGTLQDLFDDGYDLPGYSDQDVRYAIGR
jgi:Domain of unknown function (DUF5615)